MSQGDPLPFTVLVAWVRVPWLMGLPRDSSYAVSHCLICFRSPNILTTFPNIRRIHPPRRTCHRSLPLRYPNVYHLSHSMTT